MAKLRSLRTPSGYDHIHVRTLEVGDFTFVQSLASKQSSFTVPSAYLLWLLLRIDGAVCLVSEHATKGPLAYLLALPAKDPKHSMFVWQFAASEELEREVASLAVLTQFREVVAELGVKSIAFSSVPNSAAYRAVRRYAWKVFAAVPKAMNSLPPLVNPMEREFMLPLNGYQESKSPETS